MLKQLEYMTGPELRSLMNRAGKKIEEACLIEGTERPLFVAILFNDPQIGQYVSNCRREDTIKALRELADRLEKREDVPL